MERIEFFSLETPFDFGKFKGKELKKVIEEDIDYVLWCITSIENFTIDYIAIKFLQTNKNMSKGSTRLDAAYLFGSDNIAQINEDIIKQNFENVIKTNHLKIITKKYKY